MTVLLAIACTQNAISFQESPEKTTESPPTDTAIEQAPGDTAPDPVEVEHVLDAPAQANLDCGAPIMADRATDCVLTMDWPDGARNFEGAAAVHVRGRSSADFPKQQFKVELGTSEVSEPADLLGLGRESDWVLNGMWIDRALFRNKLAYDLFRRLGGETDWAPESAYVELTLDGDYLGIYLLTETVDHDASRLDFGDDDGTGSQFIVSADEEGFYSSVQYAGWAIDYPGSDTPIVKHGVESRIGAWEDLVNGAGDPFTEMDLDSFVRFVLVEEFVKNNDGFFLSHRVYTHDDGFLHMVPWDVDLSLGQPSYNDNENPASWLAYRPAFVIGSGAYPEFQARFVELWQEARQGPLATEEILGWQTDTRALLGDAVSRNWTRWDIRSVDFYGYLYPVSAPDEEYARVATFTEARLEWMDTMVANY